MKKIHHKLFFAIDCTILIKPVGQMNNGQVCAREIVNAELIYA